MPIFSGQEQNFSNLDLDELIAESTPSRAKLQKIAETTLNRAKYQKIAESIQESGQKAPERVQDLSDEELNERLRGREGYEIFNGPELEERLKRDEEAARQNTIELENDPNREGITMLVCAQHPLVDGKPGPIFKARLDEAVDRYFSAARKGEKVVIRVPGAVHAGDEISLAESGRRYLVEQGVPEDIISADGLEENGTDEITFAYNLFEQTQSKQLHICCSENQVPRNKLACISLLEILPYFHTATTHEIPATQQLGFEFANPKGALRFLREDRGVAVDAAARKKHITGENTDE